MKGHLLNMPSFNPTPTPGALREMFPEVAIDLEEYLLKTQLRKLGIQFKVTHRKELVTIEIPLTQGYVLRLTPVDRGPKGLPEVFTFFKRPKRPAKGEQLVLPVFEVIETLRLHAEVLNLNLESDNLVFSHTLHEDSIEKLIRAVIEALYQVHNLRLTPIEKKKAVRKVPKGDK